MANPPGRTYLRQWHFLGGQVLVNPDNDALTLPAGTTSVNIEAEGGVAYYAINQTGAGTGSHGYVPEEGSRVLGPVANLRTLHVHAPAATLHVTYWREA